MAQEWTDYEGLAKHLGLPWPNAYRTIWRYYKLGKIPGKRIGKQIRFHIPSVDAALLEKVRRRHHMANLPAIHT